MPQAISDDLYDRIAEGRRVLAEVETHAQDARLLKKLVGDLERTLDEKQQRLDALDEQIAAREATFQG